MVSLTGKQGKNVVRGERWERNASIASMASLIWSSR